MAVFEPEMLIFVDETGSDKRSALRKYGYALRGKPAVSERLLIRGKHYSAIAGLHEWNAGCVCYKWKCQC